jgi:hypothetical protein
VSLRRTPSGWPGKLRLGKRNASAWRHPQEPPGAAAAGDVRPVSRHSKPEISQMNRMARRGVPDSLTVLGRVLMRRPLPISPGARDHALDLEMAAGEVAGVEVVPAGLSALADPFEGSHLRDRRSIPERLRAR